jgi:hypothetical protein
MPGKYRLNRLPDEVRAICSWNETLFNSGFKGQAMAGYDAQ